MKQTKFPVSKNKVFNPLTGRKEGVWCTRCSCEDCENYRQTLVDYKKTKLLKFLRADKKSKPFKHPLIAAVCESTDFSEDYDHMLAEYLRNENGTPRTRQRSGTPISDPLTHPESQIDFTAPLQ